MRIARRSNEGEVSGMQVDLSHRGAIVTGAARGIGRAIATAFARSGATVCGIDIEDSDLDKTAEACRVAGGAFRPYICDVSAPSAVRDVCSRILADVAEIHVLVNNAGINLVKRLPELSDVEWRRVLDVNLTSVYSFCQTLWPHFVKRKGGVILNLGSVMGQRGGSDSPAYCVSKAGIAMLTRCLARDGAPAAIRANTICPGYIDTPIMQEFFAAQANPPAVRAALEAGQPMRRFGTPEDVANAALFLASDAGSYVSGIELTVDGALTATQIE
jgi:NAD(P)-dependent dehydrogenase (short-subunit alcohol dehydrogenase family)